MTQKTRWGLEQHTGNCSWRIYEFMNNVFIQTLLRMCVIFTIHTFIQLHNPLIDRGNHGDAKMSRISPTVEAAVVHTLNTL